MHESLRYLLEKTLTYFSRKEFYEQLIAAKEFYFNRTGKVFEENEDYESRMAAFNDWYVLEYRNKPSDLTCLEKYCADKKTRPEILMALKHTNHSFFEYTGTTFKGFHTFKDILHDEKIMLAKDHPAPSLLKGDIFIGRTLKYLDEYYLFNGLRVMPNEAASILKKEAKKVRKSFKNNEEGRVEGEEDFLFLSESNKTKWQHYGHVNVDKIFVFPKA